MKHVVKQKHDAGSEKCVGDAHQNKFPKGFIKKFAEHRTRLSVIGVQRKGRCDAKIIAWTDGNSKERKGGSLLP